MENNRAAGMVVITAASPKPWWKSKAKIAAIITVLVGAIHPISEAMGHPITVPDWGIQILVGMGMYGIRDSIKT